MRASCCTYGSENSITFLLILYAIAAVAFGIAFCKHFKPKDATGIASAVFTAIFWLPWIMVKVFSLMLTDF